MCTIPALSNTSAPQPDSQSGTTWSGVVDFRHPTRPGFVQCRRLPMFDSDGGRPSFNGRFPLRDWQEMYSRENKLLLGTFSSVLSRTG